jgi:hypothetical protein
LFGNQILFDAAYSVVSAGKFPVLGQLMGQIKKEK